MRERFQHRVAQHRRIDAGEYFAMMPVARSPCVRLYPANSGNPRRHIEGDSSHTRKDIRSEAKPPYAQDSAELLLEVFENFVIWLRQKKGTQLQVYSSKVADFRILIFLNQDITGRK